MQASPSFALDCCNGTDCSSSCSPQTVNVPGPAGGITDCSECQSVYVKIGEGGEPDTPSDTTVVQIVQNIDGTQWVWNPTTQTWIEVNPSLPSGIYTPDTVDDLRLIDDNGLLRMAFTAGTVTRFDGQARSYKWNPDDDRPDDGIQVVRPASQAAGAYGAWNEL